MAILPRSHLIAPSPCDLIRPAVYSVVPKVENILKLIRIPLGTVEIFGGVENVSGKDRKAIYLKLTGRQALLNLLNYTKQEVVKLSRSWKN